MNVKSSCWQHFCVTLTLFLTLCWDRLYTLKYFVSPNMGHFPQQRQQNKNVKFSFLPQILHFVRAGRQKMLFTVISILEDRLCLWKLILESLKYSKHDFISFARSQLFPFSFLSVHNIQIKLIYIRKTIDLKHEHGSKRRSQVEYCINPLVRINMLLNTAINGKRDNVCSLPLLW